MAHLLLGDLGHVAALLAELKQGGRPQVKEPGDVGFFLEIEFVSS